MTPDQYLQLLMGLATLANSAILWPLFRALKKNDARHDDRLEKLEKKKTRARGRK